MSQRRFQPLLALFLVGHLLRQQLEYARIVVAALDVTQLVGYHILDAAAGSAHQIDVQRHGAGAAPAGLHDEHDQTRFHDCRVGSKIRQGFDRDFYIITKETMAKLVSCFMLSIFLTSAEIECSVKLNKTYYS